jgi:hypothetical protein
VLDWGQLPWPLEQEAQGKVTQPSYPAKGEPQLSTMQDEQYVDRKHFFIVNSCAIANESGN